MDAVELLKRKHNCLMKINELNSEYLSKMIDIDFDWNDLLIKRQIYIDIITEINLRLNEIDDYTVKSSNKSWNNAELIEEQAKLIQLILDQDLRLISLVEAQKEMITRELFSLRAHRDFVSRYDEKLEQHLSNAVDQKA